MIVPLWLKWVLFFTTLAITAAALVVLVLARGDVRRVAEMVRPKPAQATLADLPGFKGPYRSTGVADIKVVSVVISTQVTLTVDGTDLMVSTPCGTSYFTATLDGEVVKAMKRTSVFRDCPEADRFAHGYFDTRMTQNPVAIVSGERLVLHWSNPERMGAEEVEFGRDIPPAGTSTDSHDEAPTGADVLPRQ